MTDEDDRSSPSGEAARGNPNDPVADDMAELARRLAAQPGHGQTQLPIELTVQQATSWSGPIPPPEAIERLNAVEPGLGTRLVQEFIAETDHRRQLERQSIRANEGAMKRGQWFAFILFLVIALGAIVLGMNDHPTAAVAIAGMEIGIPAAAYLYHRRRGQPDDS